MLCPGGYKKHITGKALETGDWSFQQVEKGRPKEQRQRWIQSHPGPQIVQECLKS